MRRRVMRKRRRRKRRWKCGYSAHDFFLESLVRTKVAEAEGRKALMLN